ncbi:MAG: cadherin repeat domain-containing protein, partial [Blastocatellia bacterium]
MGKRSFPAALLILFLILPLLVPAAISIAAANQAQVAEVKAFLYADGGFFQPVTAGFTSNFDANGYGGFNWDFNNPSATALQNARLIVFLDADLDHATTTFFNEHGALVNLNPPPGAAPGDIAASSWEIDEPGFLFGDIARHLATGVLDQTNSVPASAPDDVSLALGFNLGALPANAPVKVRCFISATNIGGLSQTDSDTNTTLYFNGYIQRSQSLAITPSTITRQQGSPATTSAIATVSDGITPAGSLAVTVTTPAPGISVTNITNNNGAITASVAATCTAALGNHSVGLSVTNGGGVTATANLIVAVTANTPPALGVYPATSLNLGGGATVTPAGAPSDNGSITNLAASIAPGGFAGTLSINQTTGAVTVSNAGPKGSYTVTVTATDNCGAASTRAFPLTVGEDQGCVPPNCPTVGPGVELASGSVLVFNLYTSSASNPNNENTRINLTNTDPSRAANIHLFFVDGSNCAVADANICLTPNQTMSFLASDLDPGTTGYIIAIATDRQGCPIRFNRLIGDAYVKLAAGQAANLAAEAIPAIAAAPSACNNTSSTATIEFDGERYAQLPRTVALDSLASPNDNNSTLLVLNRIGGDLATGASTLGALTGVLYDDGERGFSFSLNGGCQLRGLLSNNFPRTTPRITQVIPAGHSGWMKLSAATDAAILGAALNFNPNATTSSGAFNQGRNLH